MDTIDITITKNKLQILILQAQENIKKQATNSKKEALDTLTDAYSTICFLQAALDNLQKKNLIAEQNNIKAYRQNQQLKKKLVVLYSMNLYMINLDYIYYVMFVVCIVSFFAGMLTHYLFNRN